MKFFERFFKKKESMPMRQYRRYVEHLKSARKNNTPALPPPLPWMGMDQDDFEEFFLLLEGMRALYREQSKKEV